MLAQPLLAPKNPRTARAATHRRISRKERAKYAGMMRFCGALAGALALVMLYVMLTARLTGLGYAVSRAEHQRAALQADAARLDDRLAALRSDDRLASVAARLHMQDPAQFAVVTVPRPHRTAPAHPALFSDLANLFIAK